MNSKLSRVDVFNPKIFKLTFSQVTHSKMSSRAAKIDYIILKNTTYMYIGWIIIVYKYNLKKVI